MVWGVQVCPRSGRKVVAILPKVLMRILLQEGICGFSTLLLVSCARSMYVSTSKHGQQPGEERGRRRMDEEEAREEERRSRQARETPFFSCQRGKKRRL